MIDITPELLEKIKSQFNQEYDKSSSIKGVLSKIEKGSATYEDANNYAREIGEILSGALTDNLSSSVLPDGKMYYNIANEIFNDVLGNNYELATNVSASVQQVLNEKSGIGLNAIRPNVDQKRIDGIIDKVSNEDTFDKIKWIVGEPVVNYTQSAVDETIKQNSEFQYKAGLRPKIVRKLGGKCCDWCAKLVGEYSYPDVPKDVYRRHENCRCTVEYINGTKRQNVHTKSYIEEHAEEVRERINLSNTHKLNANSFERLENKGINVNIDGSGKFREQANVSLLHLDRLTDEYNNTVVSYIVGKTGGIQTEMGSAYMLKNKTAITISPLAFRKIKATDALNLGNNQPLGTTYHEFAHALSQSKEKIDQEFWKEIRKIKKDYESNRGANNWFNIKISEYASKDIDEFMAESFTQAKLGVNPSPYSKQVLAIIDKYFKKK